MKISWLLVFLPCLLFSQTTSKKIRVLFIGNSYTYVNNLPQLVADMALSCGDTVIYDSNCIGGYTFGNHYLDAVTKSKIALGTWQYVVLQAQSQEPSFPPTQVSGQTLPYALKLDSLVKAANPCAQTVFYETWGRKNGDAVNCAFYPPLCTYTGMQNRLKESYLLFGDSCKALVAPVGEAWRASITNSPSLELYQADESHPIVPGSYLAAAVFYEMLFGKSVLTASYTAGLSATLQTHLLSTAHATVQDSLALWNVGAYSPDAGFASALNGNTLQFAANSSNFNHLFTFGDGATSTQTQGVHVYSVSGQYTVTHAVSNTCKTDLKTAKVTVVAPNGLADTDLSAIKIVSPFTDELIIQGSTTSDIVIRIVDLQGRELFTAEHETSISTRDWKNGLYVLELKSGNTLMRYKVLKYAN